MSIRFILFSLVVMISFGGVSAKGNKGACKEDVQKFCKDVKKGHGAIWKCLENNQANLSQKCQDRLAKGKERMKKAHEACQADEEKLCSSVKKGEGRMIKCLHKNFDQLSDSCKSVMKKHHGKMKKKEVKEDE